MNISSATRSAADGLSAREEKLLRELVRALREIRYGSVVLTVHDGRVMEIHKTEKIRVDETLTREG